MSVLFTEPSHNYINIRFFINTGIEFLVIHRVFPVCNIRRDVFFLHPVFSYLFQDLFLYSSRVRFTPDEFHTLRFDAPREPTLNWWIS